MHPFTLKLACLLALLVPTGLTSSDAKDLAREAAHRGETLASATLDEDGYRDKKRLCLDLEPYFDGAAPSAKDAKKAAKLVAKIVHKNSPPGLVWRVEELRGRLLMHADPGDAAAAYDAALEAYPAETYAYPSKQSYFHHLAIDAALAHWSADGVKSAEAMLESIATNDDRLAGFYPDRLEARYLSEGKAEALRALYERLAAALEPRNAGLAKELRGRSIPDIRSVDGDPKKVYVLLGADRTTQKPRDLVVVMPGGNGQALDFQDWVGRISKPLLDRYVFAILSAPQWNEAQAQEFVWVTESSQREYGAEFPVEQFAREAVAEIRSDKTLSIDDAFLFAWSSGGPAAYATVLSKDDTFRGAYVLASVFKPNQLDLKYAKTRRFWLEQGTADKITAVRFARDAEKRLTAKGAEVQLVEFDGGHGFAMPDASGSLEAALTWLGR